MSSRIFSLLAAALLVAAAPVWAQPADQGDPVDPPDRVGRLSVVEGAVQQRTADDQQWMPASLNYPVTGSFAVATQDGRAEIEVGSLALRIGANSELDVNTLTDNTAVVTLAQGEANLRLGRLSADGHIQVVTPRGIVDIVAPGQYHFDAGSADSPTAAGTFGGKAQLERDTGPMDVVPGEVVLVSGDASTGPQISTAQIAPDELDKWSFARDQQAQRPPSAESAPPPQLSPGMTGAADLGAYGNWSSDPDYGTVWYPGAVPAGWAPYHYGHWAWVSPWGWTWIDDQPWGFAPFHYGRWVYRTRGWGWVPGVAVARPVYAPALVVFVGSPGGHLFIGSGIEGVAWFPLGPREVFVPSYRTSVAYVRNVNATSVNVTNIHITRINNQVVVNNNNGGVTNGFANRRFVTAVPTNAFASARPVHQAAVATPAALTSGSLPVAHSPGVSPPPQAAHAATGSAGAPAHAPQNQNQTFSRGSNATHLFPTLPPGSGTAPTNAAVTPNATTPGNGRNTHALPPMPPSHGNAVVNRTPGNAPVAAPNPGPAPSKNAIVNPTPTPQNGAAPGGNNDRSRDTRGRPQQQQQQHQQGSTPANPALVTPRAPPKPAPAAIVTPPPPTRAPVVTPQVKAAPVPPSQPPRGNPPPANAVHNGPPPGQPPGQSRDANRGQPPPHQEQNKGAPPPNKNAENPKKDNNGN